ncbi:hypothetical protein BDV12DRAFT_174893 [Aspergillus spectabilis]
MWNYLILATWLVVPAVASSSPEVLCVYPLSGVYAPLQRILFYVLLAFGIIGRRQRWLVAGALASAMTYCGAAAIHSFFLIAKARSTIVDLDVYGVFAATSTGIMLTAPLLAWSTTLQTVEREIRTLIILWTILISVGAILATAAIYIRGSTEGPPCLGSLADIATGTVSTLQNPLENCTFVRSPLSSSRLLQLLRPPPILSRVELGWIGEWLFERRRRDRGSFARINSVADEAVRYPWLLRAYQYYFVFGSFGVFVVNLVLNEVRFRSLPTNEMPYEVGQWSPWVGVAMILFAQLLSQVSKGGWKEKGDEADGEELRIWDRNAGEADMRTSTFHSEASAFRRRNSF